MLLRFIAKKLLKINFIKRHSEKTIHKNKISFKWYTSLFKLNQTENQIVNFQRSLHSEEPGFIVSHILCSRIFPREV